jgi:hypothetical protein
VVVVVVVCVCVEVNGSSPPIIKWWRHLNRLEDVKPVKKINVWNSTGIRTNGRRKYRWRDEVINDVKKRRETGVIS